MSESMLPDNDPARDELISRALSLGIQHSPDAPIHHLGKIILANSKTVNAHVVHAVEAIITDGKNIVMINRLNPPGEGKPALPGGWMDYKKDNIVETAEETAIREAEEETGAIVTNGKLVGQRVMNRPHDIRVARKDMPALNIKKGDVFMVSTQAVRFSVENVNALTLEAKDDAAPNSARFIPLKNLTYDYLGIPDHFDLIKQAIPEAFG